MSIVNDCAAQHFGAWAVEPRWFRDAAEAVKAGLWKPAPTQGMTAAPHSPVAAHGDDDEREQPEYEVRNGIAVIAIDGMMTKRGSSFGGCSTLRVRHALRSAATDFSVRAILLHICSPGGTVLGTADLAEDIVGVMQGRFGAAKVVDAYVADMCCSAAYWVASQCRRITANSTALVGSIGTYTVLSDVTQNAQQDGFKYTVVSSGPYKGLGADGSVSDLLISDVQREIDELNAPFLAAVAAGRAGRINNLAEVSDGRAHVGSQALALGLIDAIASLDTAIAAITPSLTASFTPVRARKVSMTPTPTEQVKSIAAAHPEAVAEYVQQGRAAAITEQAARLAALENECGGRPQLVLDLFKAGKTADDARLVVAQLDFQAAQAKADAQAAAARLAEQAKEIERLRFEAGGAKPVAVPAANAPQPEAEENDEPSVEQIVAAAKADWDANRDGCRDKWINLAAYTGYQKARAMGRM